MCVCTYRYVRWNHMKSLKTKQDCEIHTVPSAWGLRALLPGDLVMLLGTDRRELTSG